MKVGQIDDVVNVVGEATTVDTTQRLDRRPDRRRADQEPAAERPQLHRARHLTPGVQLTTQGGRSTSTGFGQKISVNGSRYTQNLFTLDGTMMNDQFNQAGSASGNMLGVEAVREFQVLTNSFSAEYGRHTGAVVNAATKTGTNAFRGSVFEFHRNEALDANRWEAERNNLSKPDFTRNQFGFSAGGPIAAQPDLLLRRRTKACASGSADADLQRADRRGARRRQRHREAVPGRVPEAERPDARRAARGVRAQDSAQTPTSTT